MKSRVETLSIDLIKPYWRNPRENTKAIEKVKESIKLYGYNQYLVLDEDLVIIAGHSRYKALKELGYTEIPVIIVDLDKEQAKEYRIADNKTNEYAEWNYPELVVELRELQNVGNLQKIFEEDLYKIIAKSVGDGKGFTEIGGNKVREMEEEMQRKFQDIAGVQLEQVVDVTCPNCSHVFGINKSDSVWNQKD